MENMNVILAVKDKVINLASVSIGHPYENVGGPIVVEFGICTLRHVLHFYVVHLYCGQASNIQFFIVCSLWNGRNTLVAHC